jgi:hypothetical protein
VSAVPSNRDSARIQDDCSHREHTTDSRHRGDQTIGEYEELGPGQRCLQIHQESRVCQTRRQDSIQVIVPALKYFIKGIKINKYGDCALQKCVKCSKFDQLI